jgi:hypothetical protein
MPTKMNRSDHERNPPLPSNQRRLKENVLLGKIKKEKLNKKESKRPTTLWYS